MKYEELKQILIKEAKDIESYVIDIRRKIHMNPETAFEENHTSILIEKELHKIGFKTQRTAKTGVIASIFGEENEMCVVLRADIDALNITEENDIPYRSKIPGKMHACGHDAHTAMLLGASKLLFKYKKHLKGTLKIIFQPGEEGGAGAKKIIDDGHFNNVDAVFGIHIWYETPAGIISTRKGPIFASSDRFSIIIKGKGGHVASPHQTIDPTSVLMDIYNALQKIISREINPFEPCVLALPKLKASDAHNIIPSEVILNGTLRTLSPNIRKYIIRRIHEIVEGYSKAWRCTSVVVFDPMAYPPVINDTKMVEKISIILKDLDEVKVMNQSMVGEDFAFYLQKTNGVFLTLGTFNKEKKIIYPHHHPKFQVDESVLWKGTAIYSILGFFALYE